MRTSVIGFGRMGARLCDAAERAGQEVVAVLDGAEAPFGLGPRPDLAGRLHRDPEPFWATPADILVIGTTAPSHMPLLEQGVRRGFKRIVVEKPFSCSVAEGRRAMEVAQAAGARVLVDHTRRYCPNFQKIAARAPELAHLGRLRTISSTHGGGSLGCVGVHYFDLCNMLFGAAPVSVFAQLVEPEGRNPRGDQFLDPGGPVMLTYPNGGRAFVDYGGDIGVYAGLQMVFEEGIVRHGVDEFEPWEVLARRAEDRGKGKHLIGLPLMAEPFPAWSAMSHMDRWTQLFVDAASDAPPVCGADVGLRTMEVFAAARWSAATGSVVKLPLPPEAEEASYPIP
jgi:predicted dehydrogenase